MARATPPFKRWQIIERARRTLILMLMVVVLAMVGSKGGSSFLFFVSLALVAMGCGTGYALGAAQAKPLVLMHAEDDLDCPERDLRLEEGWGGRWEATGCGRSANYNAKCMGIQCDVVPAGSAVPWADSPTYDMHASH